MKVKTQQNDENNRGKHSKKDLKNEILFTWLEGMVLGRNLDEDPLELERDIASIRKLIDEPDMQAELLDVE